MDLRLEEKQCAMCKEVKPLEAFHRAKANKDGRHSKCMPCRSKARRRKYPVRGPEHEGQKYCYGCQSWKPLDDFQRHSTSNDGRQTRCRPCANAVAQAWTKENPNYYTVRKERDPDYFRRSRLKRLYNLTLEAYDEMLASQGGVCAICLQAERRKLQGQIAPLVVDHCHRTGAVRGLLCHACNTALGHVDRPEWLTAARAYLKERE